MKVQTRFITATEAKLLTHMLVHKRTSKRFQSIVKLFESVYFYEVDGIDNIYISQASKDLFISEKTVRNCITFLVKKGFLRRHEKGNYTIPETLIVKDGSTYRIKDIIIINHE